MLKQREQMGRLAAPRLAQKLDGETRPSEWFNKPLNIDNGSSSSLVQLQFAERISAQIQVSERKHKLPKGCLRIKERWKGRPDESVYQNSLALGR